MPADLRARLEWGLAELPLDLPESARERLLAYLLLLHKWNGAYNLTAVREPLKMVSAHLLDSLAVLPHVRGPRVLDVGTGPGLPGIPLAIVRPEWELTLLDSNGKKTRFVTQAGIELGLHNVTVVHSRVEDYVPGLRFDSIVSRAFASLSEMVAATGRLLAPRGRLVAMKGAYPAAELAKLEEGVEVEAVQPLTVPGLAAERHVVLIGEA